MRLAKKQSQIKYWQKDDNRVFYKKAYRWRAKQAWGSQNPVGACLHLWAFLFGE